MEPLGKILALYKDKEKVLLHYLPSKTVSELRGYRYRDGGYTDDLVYLGELVTLVSKMTGVSLKGKVIRNTDGHLTLRKGKINRRFPISDYYVFVKPKAQKSASDKRAFIEALLQSL
tara:strand:- start:114 stop:464 length:351 start_codon:yes stop_codon:yes gene_type:complete